MDVTRAIRERTSVIRARMSMTWVRTNAIRVRRNAIRERTNVIRACTSPIPARPDVIRARTSPIWAQRVVTIYRPLILLLTAFSNFPLMRPSWRSPATMFLQALDQLAAGVPPAPPAVATAAAAVDTDPVPTAPDFKAGKDL